MTDETADEEVKELKARRIWIAMFFGKLSVLLYFFVVSIAMAYAACTLWMASPKETPSEAATLPPACTDVGGEPPKVTRLEPESVAVGENYVGVAVVGCNFSDKAKVRFNGVERTSQAAGSNQLNVPLFASDFAGAANVAVSVEVVAEAPPPKDGKNEPARVLRSNVKNLRIKPPADVKVVWIFSKTSREITVELRLILLVLLVGAFAACVSGLNSFVNYAGEEKLKANWMWFYFARPVIGAGVAFVFYLIIRGGFLAGTNADARAVNPFGFVAVAALVGMFADAALMKLNDVFDTLFRSRDSRKQGLDAPPVIETGDVLPEAKVGQPYRQELKAKEGTLPYVWSEATPLPAWLKISQGFLQGTPAAAATEKFTLQVTDAQGKTAKKELTLKIVP